MKIEGFEPLRHHLAKQPTGLCSAEGKVNADLWNKPKS